MSATALYYTLCVAQLVLAGNLLHCFTLETQKLKRKSYFLMQRMLFHCSQTGEVEEPDYSVVFKLEYTINIVFESLQHKIGVTFHHCGEAIVRWGWNHFQHVYLLLQSQPGRVCHCSALHCNLLVYSIGPSVSHLKDKSGLTLYFSYSRQHL